MFRPVIAVVTLLAASAASAEVVFDESFDENPCAPSSGWVCRGDAVWVAPGAAPCPSADPALFAPWSTFDPLGPCTILPGNGYALLTPALPDRGGAIYRAEPVSLANLRLAVDFELRDGAPGERGDGLAVVLVGSPEPPGLGARGGLGATGLGSHPTFICAFTNGQGEADRDEVIHAWSKTGFAADASIPGSQADVYELAASTLNSGAPHPAQANIFTFELEILEGRFRGLLTNGERQLWQTPIFDFVPDSFEPVSGYVGVTATSGSAYQNQIVHGMRLESIPPSPRFVRGDVNGSGEINIADGIGFLYCIFWLGCEPTCYDAADTDDNGQYNITDGVRILNWLFLGGPAPPYPGPLACGTDPSPDDLPTCRFPSCD